MLIILLKTDMDINVCNLCPYSAKNDSQIGKANITYMLRKAWLMEWNCKSNRLFLNYLK